MTMETRTQRRGWTTKLVWIAAAALIAGPAARPQSPQPTVRTLTGIVTDDSHEPIRGAVVELRDDKTNEVVTYITDAGGRYDFKRLDGSTDYEVWVLFRGFRSPTRNISKFDGHLAKVIDFKVRTF
jgi:hypothetical protein